MGIFFIQNRSGRCFHEKNARGRQIENVRRISRRSGFRRCLGKNKGSLKGKNVFWENIVLNTKNGTVTGGKNCFQGAGLQKEGQSITGAFGIPPKIWVSVSHICKKAQPATFLLHFSRRTCTFMLAFFRFPYKIDTVAIYKLISYGLCHGRPDEALQGSYHIWS